MRPVLPVSYRGAIKPTSPHSIDKQHSLARGLVGYWLLNERGNQPYNLVKATPATMGAGSLSWVPGPDGMAASFNGSAQVKVGTDQTAGTGVRVPAAPMSVVARALFTSLPGPFMNNIFVTDQDATVGGHYTGFRLSVTTGGLIDVLVGDSIGSTGSSNAAQTIGTTTISSNVWNTYGCTFLGPSGNVVSLYLNGKPESSTFSGNTVTMGLTTTGWAGIGATTLNGGQWNGQISWVGVWNRTLSAGEHFLLHNDPYCIFRDIGIAPGSFGAILTLSGQAAGVATVSGTVRRIIGFSGTSAGVTSVSGDLKKTQNLTGTAAGVTSITSNFVNPPPVALLFTPKSPGSLTFTEKTIGTLQFTPEVAGTLGLQELQPGTLEFFPEDPNSLVFIPIQDLE